MNRAELCELLDIDETQLDCYLTEGMPHDGNSPDEEFEEEEVSTWLLTAGKAELDRDQVATTVAEAAKRLGCTWNTLRGWIGLEGFPGDLGYFPIAEIEEWNLSRVKKVNQHADTEDVKQNEHRELSIKERRDLLKLKKEESELLDAGRVKRMLQRLGSYLVSELNTLAGRIESRLPAGTSEEMVAIMRETTQQVVIECREIISEFQLWELGDGEEEV